jgi:hypothetical protein
MTETKKMNINEKLLAIQSELKAPKGQYNSFGKYKYRSAEDILEAVKPLLAKHKALLILTDEIKVVGEEIMSDNKTLRTYVSALAQFIDTESNDVISVSAMAREPQTKTGMDASQITGTASSYARKYALNCLFCIDDTKDADTDEYHEQTKEPEQTQQTQQPQKTVEEYLKLINDCKTIAEVDKLFFEWSKIYAKGTEEYTKLSTPSWNKKKVLGA